MPSNPMISRKTTLLIKLKQMLQHSKVISGLNAPQRGYEEFEGFEIGFATKPHTLCIVSVKYSFE